MPEKARDRFAVSVKERGPRGRSLAPSQSYSRISERFYFSNNYRDCSGDLSLNGHILTSVYPVTLINLIFVAASEESFIEKGCRGEP